MERKRNWLGWIAIGLGALALAAALLGRGFGAQIGAAGVPGASVQQQSPGSQARPGAGWQGDGPRGGRSQNAQPGAGQQNAGPQNAQPQAGPGAGMRGGPAGEARRGGGRPGDSGFGLGGWLRLPFRLIGGSFQWAMLALLIGLGVWMLRGRRNTATAAAAPAEPAQSAPPAPLSPTGEAYTEEPSEQE